MRGTFQIFKEGERLMKRNRFSIRLLATTAVLATLAFGSTASAATFVAGADPTTTFASLLIDDVTPGTGGDTATSTMFSPSRNLDVPTGSGPTEVTITGIGLNPRGGTSTNLETVSVEVVYLGADGAAGGTDNVSLGTETATLQYLGSVDQYTAVFDNPIVGITDGVEDRFRFFISSTGNMRFKTFNPMQAPSGQQGLKLSVGGSAAVIPEPTAITLVALSLVGVCGLRRRN